MVPVYGRLPVPLFVCSLYLLPQQIHHHLCLPALWPRPKCRPIAQRQLDKTHQPQPTRSHHHQRHRSRSARTRARPPLAEIPCPPNPRRHARLQHPSGRRVPDRPRKNPSPVRKRPRLPPAIAHLRPHQTPYRHPAYPAVCPHYPTGNAHHRHRHQT